MDRQQKVDPQHRYRVLDSQTGESRLAITWFRKKWKGNTFFMGFQEGFAEIARKRLGSEAKDVFLFILGTLDYSNQVVVRQVDIARELGMKKQNVSRAIKTLIKEEVLVIEDPLFKRKGPLRLNHKYAWKGKLKQLGLLPQPLEDGEKQESRKKSQQRDKPKE